jgi:hypothetical protein
MGRVPVASVVVDPGRDLVATWSIRSRPGPTTVATNVGTGVVTKVPMASGQVATLHNLLVMDDFAPPHSVQCRQHKAEAQRTRMGHQDERE